MLGVTSAEYGSIIWSTTYKQGSSFKVQNCDHNIGSADSLLFDSTGDLIVASSYMMTLSLYDSNGHYKQKTLYFINNPYTVDVDAEGKLVVGFYQEFQLFY